MVFVFVSQLYGHGPKTWAETEKDGLIFYTGRASHRCFVAGWTWDGDEDHLTITIPDKFNGYAVTQLGGYNGRGGSPFCIKPPPEWGAQRCDWQLVDYLNQYRVIKLKVTLILGIGKPRASLEE